MQVRTLLDEFSIFLMFPGVLLGRQAILQPLFCYHCRTNRAEAADFTRRSPLKLEGQPVYTADRYTLVLVQDLEGPVYCVTLAQMVETFITCL
ncbi:hypothetical protein C8R31_104252 [Nitrosospira sp. Nsp2]|nr:hypothetical protein C8R31_104252 [Nitrosospira sp. Nsp2]